MDNYRFYSPLVSAAQRLPNGNTLITEGIGSRLIEVTRMKEIVWEFIAPYETTCDFIYRAYRYPYSYVPQLPEPVETPVERLDIKKLRIPGAVAGELDNIVEIPGVMGWPAFVEQCVTAVEGESLASEDDDDEVVAQF